MIMTEIWDLVKNQPPKLDAVVRDEEIRAGRRVWIPGLVDLIHLHRIRPEMNSDELFGEGRPARGVGKVGEGRTMRRAATRWARRARRGFAGRWRREAAARHVAASGWCGHGGGHVRSDPDMSGGEGGCS